MQIKSWQIALIQFIVQVIFLGFSYFQIALMPCTGGCDMAGLAPLYYLGFFIATGATLFAALLLSNLKKQKVGAILSIILGIVWIKYSWIVISLFIILNGINNVFIADFLGYLLGIFLVLAGIYYFFKERKLQP